MEILFAMKELDINYETNHSEPHNLLRLGGIKQCPLIVSSQEIAEYKYDGTFYELPY